MPGAKFFQEGDTEHGNSIWSNVNGILFSPKYGHLVMETRVES